MLYVVIVKGDKYQNSERIQLLFMSMADPQKVGFKLKLKGVIIKNKEGNRGNARSGVKWKYRA